MFLLPHICGPDHGCNEGAHSADRRKNFPILFFDLPFEGLVACAFRSTPSGRYSNVCSTTWLKKNCNIPQTRGRDPGRTELHCGGKREIWESGNLGLRVCCVIRLYSEAGQMCWCFGNRVCIALRTPCLALPAFECLGCLIARMLWWYLLNSSCFALLSSFNAFIKSFQKS